MLRADCSGTLAHCQRFSLRPPTLFLFILSSKKITFCLVFLRQVYTKTSGNFRNTISFIYRIMFSCFFSCIWQKLSPTLFSFGGCPFTVIIVILNVTLTFPVDLLVSVDSVCVGLRGDGQTDGYCYIHLSK